MFIQCIHIVSKYFVHRKTKENKFEEFSFWDNLQGYVKIQISHVPRI